MCGTEHVNLQIDNHVFSKCEHLYFGTLPTDNKNEETEIINRMNAAKRCLHASNKMLISSYYPTTHN